MLLIGVAARWFFRLFLLLPLGAVFAEALRRGWEVFLASLHDEAALSAIKLTLLAAAISVPLNTLFGVSAAWLVTKYRFKGRAFLLSLIDLPFAVSPVIAGLVWVMIFGQGGSAAACGSRRAAALRIGLRWLFADYRMAGDPKIVFAFPGIVIATVFVTFPFVARELIPLMEIPGQRPGGSRRHARCEGLADFLPRHPA